MKKLSMPIRYAKGVSFDKKTLFSYLNTLVARRSRSIHKPYYLIGFFLVSGVSGEDGIGYDLSSLKQSGESKSVRS